MVFVLVNVCADAQVRALSSQKCQRRRLDAGLDSFRRIENAFCRVFGLKEVDRHVEHHHVRCGDASRRPCFEKRARCRISLGWAVRETLLHGSVVRRRGLDGVSGGSFLILGSHRAIQSQPRSPSSHPEAAAQSDELGCL